MNESALKPYWNLGNEEHYNLLSNVQLFLWAKGICISGHSADGELLEANAYETENVYDLEAIKKIILNEPLLADPQPVSKVWLAKSRSMLVPESLSDRKNIDAWFRELYFVEHDESMSTAHAKDYGIDIYFPKKDVLKKMMKQYFPNRQSKFLLPPKVLNQFFSSTTNKRVYVIFLEHTCSITFLDGEKIIHNTIIDIENREDIVVAIADYWKIEKEELQKVELIVSGIASNLQEWTDELRDYFLLVNANKDFSTKVFLKQLALCE